MDHAALTKYPNGKKLSSRMIRWTLNLSEFNIDWEHRPGTQNVVADVLSRNPVNNVEGSQISCGSIRALALNSREQLIQEQREDPDDNCPQFISDVFERLSHRLDIKHIKTVTYRPQSNLTERVNRTLVQMIACFVEENHDNWDQFLHEFSFALRSAINGTTGPYIVLEVQNNNFIIWKRGRRVTVNVDQVRIYHPRNSETSSYDSINETTYEGKESSNWSNRSNSGKSRDSKKPSGNENKSCKSDKGNAGLEDLRVKRERAVESTGTSKRYGRKRPKLCRKRSFRVADYEQNRKRKAPVLPQGLKRGASSSIYSRSRKYMKDINKNCGDPCGSHPEHQD
ncbi:uncharacterized protein TNCV_4897741 [Trichonephila clavipes]|nr:uncharacterized protein TNCV_4897741 [Trichonephila clavipes]